MTDSTSAASQTQAEKVFVEALRKGDEAAYERLVRTYVGPLQSVARRYLRNEEDARDVVQDAFASVVRSIDRFEGESKLSTWLHRIVVNAALMKLRTQRRKPEESIDDLLPGFLEDGHQREPASEWAQSASRALERKEIRERVRDSIGQLPEGYRMVLMLRDMDGYDTDQTAELLGIQRGAVKTRLHRARQALRGLLDPHMRDEVA